MISRLRIKVIGFVLMAVCMFTACGQKLPLYLPEESTSNNTTQDLERSTKSAEQGKD